MNSICIFGVFVADLCFFAEKIPVKGETILGKKHLVGPGGKGSNQAISAARLNGNVNFITKIGSSLGLFNTSSTDNSTSNLAQNTSKYNLTEETSGKNGYYHPDDGVMRRYMPFSKPLASESPAAKRSKGINTYPGGGQGGGGMLSTVKNFFGLAKDKDHQVSPKTMMGGVVNNLQKRRMMIEMFGDESIGGGTTGGLMNIMNDLTSSMSTIQSGDSFKNISKNLVTSMSGIANSSNTKSCLLYTSPSPRDS